MSSLLFSPSIFKLAFYYLSMPLPFSLHSHSLQHSPYLLIPLCFFRNCFEPNAALFNLAFFFLLIWIYFLFLVHEGAFGWCAVVDVKRGSWVRFFFSSFGTFLLLLLLLLLLHRWSLIVRSLPWIGASERRNRKCKTPSSRGSINWGLSGPPLRASWTGTTNSPCSLKCGTARRSATISCAAPQRISTLQHR